MVNFFKSWYRIRKAIKNRDFNECELKRAHDSNLISPEEYQRGLREIDWFINGLK